MRTEWAEAGAWSRTLFVIVAIYWLAMALLFILSLPVVRNGYELGLVFGFYFVPLAYALVGILITTARVTTAS